MRSYFSSNTSVFSSADGFFMGICLFISKIDTLCTVLENNNLRGKHYLVYSTELTSRYTTVLEIILRRRYATAAYKFVPELCRKEKRRARQHSKS